MLLLACGSKRLTATGSTSSRGGRSCGPLPAGSTMRRGRARPDPVAYDRASTPRPGTCHDPIPAGTLPCTQRFTHMSGNELLSTQETELLRMGYTDGALLGYLAASAPVTGRLGTTGVGVAWARCFGLDAGVS